MKLLQYTSTAVGRVQTRPDFAPISGLKVCPNELNPKQIMSRGLIKLCQSYDRKNVASESTLKVPGKLISSAQGPEDRVAGSTDIAQFPAHKLLPPPPPASK